jgi:light-regulated signal transduction histidine kinase (bacteriophytochrome)
MSEVAALDLATCDREPIHIPGSIQPHGVLLVAESSTQRIVQVAGNTRNVIGPPSPPFLGNSIKAVLGPAIAALIQSGQGVSWHEPFYLGSLTAAANPDKLLDVTAHIREGLIVVEIEPAAAKPQSAAQMLAKVRRISLELGAAGDLPALLQAAVRAIRTLVGFDRVMVYRFLDDGTGAVIAEDRAENLNSLVNHHYPASDIPTQARALYLKNLIRVIPDVSYAPAPLIPEINPMTGKPLDMSDCSLRSVSPIHVQYLKNMGVAASMSVSIVVDGRLWGLVSCHHRTPRLVPYEIRETCKYIGQLIGHEVKAREELDMQRKAFRLSVAREEFIHDLGSAAVEEGLLSEAAGLKRLIPCDGAAIVFGTQIRRIGHAPSDDQIRTMLDWIVSSSSSDVYATNSLIRDYTEAETYASIASGVLACLVDRELPAAVLWFRAEQIETINWAGNPHKPAELGSQPGILTPRKSFEVWRETVRHQARSWYQPEIDAARRLGQAILQLRQQSTVRELNLQLRRTLSDKELLLTQKELLMQEVNHRVQNSLQLVNSMLNHQARQTSNQQVKAHFQEASRRIMAVSTVHRRLWRRADHIQNVDFGAYVEELRDALLESWGESWAGQIKIINADHVLVPTNQAVILALIVTELLTNSVKYAYDGRPGPLEISVAQKARTTLQVIVRDAGVGIREHVPKTGLGSKLVRSLVSQIGGELQVLAASPGTSVAVTVPLWRTNAH